ncbi:MAG TPA: RNA polymerase sigma-54 factor [candidate division Zixibacteria bacterium]|nr:RNA polymerase sigma-54 factor [candidate division Zixibacteria bacterium]
MPDIRLEQKLSLKQVLTPQLIQSLQLLQIPKLELETELRAELEQNPVLDIVEEDPIPADERTTEDDLDRDLDDWDKFADGLNLYGTQLPENDPDVEEIAPYFGVSNEETLSSHLLSQLCITVKSPRLYDIGEFIIGNLDERGFLPLSDEELRNELIANDIIEDPTPEEIAHAVTIIQSFSPSGVAAHDLRESFLIQLADKGKEGTVAWKIVHDHFQQITTRNVPQLADILGVPVPEAEEAMHVLAMLSFSPGADFAVGTSGRIDPDLIIEKVQGRWIVRYNGAGIPELKINNAYRSMLKHRESLDTDTKRFLSKKLNSAQWWIKALNQRKDTMVRTMRAILHHQFAFFEQGPSNLLPLKMEEIAEEVDVHPATISRVVRDKYVQTPFGVYPLRHFFGGGLATETGEDIATENVKRLIENLIEEEDSAKPLADQKITENLNERGIQIARRTVAKYREEMGIPTARMRKKRRK